MGLDLDLVLSDSRHYGPFICAICQSLTDLDCVVTVGCSHTFCRQCLPYWLDTNHTTCPTCNNDLLYTNSESQGQASMMMGSHSVSVQPLATLQPLAHRLLKSILVKCPLGVGCKWQGDYGDLQSHLLSATAHDTKAKASAPDTNGVQTVSMETDDDDESAVEESSRERHESLASSLKEEANSQFETKHYKEAISLYSKAISVLKEYEATNKDNSESPPPALLTTLYSNRAATYLQMQEYRKCLDDCIHVLTKLDTTNVKVFVRASRASVQLGELESSMNYIVQGLDRKPENSVLQKEGRRVQQMREWSTVGKQQLKEQQYAAAKAAFSNLLKEASSAIPFLLGAAQSDLGLGLTDSALRLTKRVLIQHTQNPKGCWIRGQALFLMGDAKVGIQLMQEALRLDPDSKELRQSYKTAKKVNESIQEARKKMFARHFKETVELLTFGIQQYHPLPPKAPLYATMYTQRAKAYLRLKQFKETLKDCALVLYAQEDYIPAWFIRFDALHGMVDHETALNEVKDLLQKFPQDESLRKAYQQADFLLRKQRRVDFYALLGISSIASEMEIKKAYKRKALELHPDKLPPGSSPKKQKQAQEQFQLLGEGLEILCDDFMRRLYDDGYDPEAIRERVEAAKQAAHSHRGYPSNHHY